MVIAQRMAGNRPAELTASLHFIRKLEIARNLRHLTPSRRPGPAPARSLSPPVLGGDEQVPELLGNLFGYEAGIGCNRGLDHLKIFSRLFGNFVNFHNGSDRQLILDPFACISAGPGIRKVLFPSITRAAVDSPRASIDPKIDGESTLV
jgi:hypothetical protein